MSPIQRYRLWYARLLRFYPKSYYERFGESMEQTFSDLLRDRLNEAKGLFGYVVWMFVETSAGIIKNNLTSMKNKRIMYIILAIIGLLMIPLIAMQFTSEVQWTLFDFIFMGILMLAVGLGFEWALRKTTNNTYRLAAGMALAAGFFLIWVNGAVGIIGDEGNPANALYLIVVLIAFFGTIISRLKAAVMARVMYVAAAAQFLVPIIALIVWRPLMEETPGILGVFVINTFFVALWAGSGLLFKQAGEVQSK